MKENSRKCLKCGVSPAEDANVVLFRFPKPGKTNSLRCEVWAKFCFPEKPWYDPGFQYRLYSEHRMLCDKHFDIYSFIDFESKKLHRHAIPEHEVELSKVEDDNLPRRIRTETGEFIRNLTATEQHALFCTSHDHGYKMTEPKFMITGAQDIEESNQEFEHDPLQYVLFEDDLPATDHTEEIVIHETMPIAPAVVSRETTEPETEIITTEDLVLPEMDTTFLKDCGQSVTVYGDVLNIQLSTAWPPILRNGLTKEERDNIVTGYLIPNNCRLLQAPKLNPEIGEAIPEKAKVNDCKWATMQQYLGTAITAINRAMEILITGDDEDKVLALKHLSNSCLILCDLHVTHTKNRIKNITPHLDETTQKVTQGSQPDETLFGAKFSKNLKAAKKLEKRGKKKRGRPRNRIIIKREVCGPALIRYSGKWRAPLGQPKLKGRLKKWPAAPNGRRQNTLVSTGLPKPIAKRKLVRLIKPQVLNHHLDSQSEDVQCVPNNWANENIVIRPLKSYSAKKQKNVQVETFKSIPPDKGKIQENKANEYNSRIELRHNPDPKKTTINLNPGNTIIIRRDPPLVLPRQKHVGPDMPVLSTIKPEAQDPLAFTDDEVTEVVIDPLAETEPTDCLSTYLKFKGQ